MKLLKYLSKKPCIEKHLNNYTVIELSITNKQNQ